MLTLGGGTGACLTGKEAAEAGGFLFRLMAERVPITTARTKPRHITAANGLYLVDSGFNDSRCGSGLAAGVEDLTCPDDAGTSKAGARLFVSCCLSIDSNACADSVTELKLSAEGLAI